MEGLSNFLNVTAATVSFCTQGLFWSQSREDGEGQYFSSLPWVLSRLALWAANV